MKKSLNIFAAVTVTALALSLAVEPAKAATISVYQTFDTQASAAADGWATLRNTANGNNYGWNSGNEVSGTGGQAGGIFARTISGSTGYYADLTIGQSGTVAGTLNRATDSLVLSGLLRLSDSDFDGNFRLGYFNTGTFGSSTDPFLGISFAEPLIPTGPFRASITTNGTFTASISLNQNQTYGFDLTWTPSTGGAGTLSGTFAGQSVSLSALSGTGIYDAFGITNGYAVNSESTQNTNGSYFDNVTYSVVAVPEPTQMVFVAGVGAALGMWRMRKLRRNGRGSNTTEC
jgi:hypothetical protein